MFISILKNLWWRLDRAIDEEILYYSGMVCALDAIRCGTTSVIDHHASPGCVDGSLDQLEKAFKDVGLSGCLCYEVSDRNREGEGIEENERWIRKCQQQDDGHKQRGIAALFSRVDGDLKGWLIRTYHEISGFGCYGMMLDRLFLITGFLSRTVAENTLRW